MENRMWRKKQLMPDVSAVKLYRDKKGIVIQSELIEPMPLETIQKNFAGWNSLEEIVRWVEEYHDIKKNS